MKMLVEGEEGIQGQVCVQGVGGCTLEGSLKELRPSLSGEQWG